MELYMENFKTAEELGLEKGYYLLLLAILGENGQEHGYKEDSGIQNSPN